VSLQLQCLLAIVPDYLEGGDFFDLLDRHEGLSEDSARFYLAEIVLALEYLHKVSTLLYYNRHPSLFSQIHFFAASKYVFIVRKTCK